MTVHYGVIGCGAMGNEHLRNIALMEDTTVSVIYEPDAGMRERVHAPRDCAEGAHARRLHPHVSSGPHSAGTRESMSMSTRTTRDL